ncbi:MAG: ABC transporter substrate-binding protein [Cyanobacteria bacterium]|nr:ABC transporter substrate-binding protein [Cyanobacteriota bacterium]
MGLQLRSFTLQALATAGGLSLLMPLGGCQPSRPSGAGKPSLTLGAVIALTGNASLIGQDQRLGLELAQQEYGGRQPALNLRLEDGGSDEQTATLALRRLLQEPVVALIGPSLSQQAFAVDPIADRAGVPVLAPSNTAIGIPEIGPFVSRVSAPVSKVAPLSIQAARRLNPKLQRVAVFFAQDDAYSTSETKIFQQSIRSLGLNLVTVQRTSTADIDFQKPIADSLKNKPDLIVISALPNDGGNLVRQIREMGYKGLIVVGNGMNSPNIYAVCQRYCDGLLIAQAYSPETDTPINQRFVALFKQATGSASPPQFTAQAFTAYQVIHQALEQLQRQQANGQPLASMSLAELRRQLNSSLLTGTYATPLGKLKFTPQGEVIQQEFYVAQVAMDTTGKTGRFKLLSNPAPDLR